MVITVQAVAQHYLRTPEGTIYGPVDIATLCMWATDARIIPGCFLSVNRSSWTPVEAHPELRLNWSVQFDDGTTYGPLNLLAIWILAAESSIPKGVTLVEKDTLRGVVLDDTLHPLLLAECRQVLTGCSHLVGEVITALAGDQATAVSQVADRDALMTVLASKLAQAERDLAINQKLVSETQRHLSESGLAQAQLEAHSREADTLRASLASVHITLREKDAEVVTLRAKLAEADGEQAANGKQVAESQRQLAEYAAQVGGSNQDRTGNERREGRAIYDEADRESELAAIRAKCDQYENELKAEQVLTASLKDQLQESRANQDRVEARALEAERTGSDVQHALGERDQELARRKESISGLVAQVAEARAEVERLGLLQVENHGLKTELASIREQLGDACRDLQKSKEVNRATKQQLHQRQGELEAERADTRHAFETASAKARADEDTLAKLHIEHDSLSVKFKELQNVSKDSSRHILNLESDVQVARNSAEAQIAQMQSRLEIALQTLRGEQERSSQETVSLTQLRLEMTAVVSRLDAVQAALTEKEAVVRKQETDLATQRIEADRKISVLRAKNEVLDKDLQLSKQNACALALQMTQIQESVVKAQKANRMAEQRLKDEMTALQSDLNGLVLARQCTLDVADKSSPAPIDWMGGMKAPPEVSVQDAEMQSRVQKLSLAERLNLLQREMQASAEQKELLRHQMELLQARYEGLSKETFQKEREAEERLTQIQGELKTSSEQLAQAMQEVEKRESLIRELRKRGNRDGVGQPEKSTVLEAEVIHTVNLGPDQAGHNDSPSGNTVKIGQHGRAPQTDPVHSGRALCSVEAQLQRELKKWETLKRQKSNKDGTLSSWFRRKSL